MAEKFDVFEYLYNQADGEINFTNAKDEHCSIIWSRDPEPYDPRQENDGYVTRMICGHPRYKLGDDYNFFDTEDMLHSFCEELNLIRYNEEPSVKEMFSLLKDHAVILPLWLYDHSGITMSYGEHNPYNSRWDSGQVGWIVVMKKDLDAAGFMFADGEDWKQKATELIDADVKEYDMFLTGDVYRYRVLEEHDGEWEEIESIGGIFGEEALKDELRAAFDYEMSEPIDLDKEDQNRHAEPRRHPGEEFGRFNDDPSRSNDRKRDISPDL